MGGEPVQRLPATQSVQPKTLNPVFPTQAMDHNAPSLGATGSSSKSGSSLTSFKPPVFEKMESLVREMQDPESGVPIRSQKLFLTSIPSAFMGYDLIEWLMERLEVEDSAEALHLANLLCQYGYTFPVGECRSLIVKDDSSLYRFQTPYYWPSQNHTPDAIDYAIYLTKRLTKNKQKYGLEDYELENYNQLRTELADKWDFISAQADEQLKLSKDRKKGDKIVSDSQERAYWRVYRPPPGYTNCLEEAPAPDRANMANRVRNKPLSDLEDEVTFVKKCSERTRMKVSHASEALLSYAKTYLDYDPFLFPIQPCNPWVADDPTFWSLNDDMVEMPTEKRVRRWSISFAELTSDPLGLAEFTSYLRKEYCHENIRFWQAANNLRWGPSSNVNSKVHNIYEEFLKPGAPCEINIDGKTMEFTQQQMKSPSRYTYDLAAEHVYVLLLKKDCYPRFLRSEEYKNLLANALQPSQKKRRASSMLHRLVTPSMILATAPEHRQAIHQFFSFGGPGKKKTSTTVAPNSLATSQTPQALKRFGSDDTAATGQDTNTGGSESGGGSSHKLDCEAPYRGDLPAARFVGPSNSLELKYSIENALVPYREPDTAHICPWDMASDSPIKTQLQATSLSHLQQPAQQRQTLTYSKTKPDRSKSVDCSSVGNVCRVGSVSVPPVLSPVLAEPQTSAEDDVCPWETQALPPKQEKSDSVDSCQSEPCMGRKTPSVAATQSSSLEKNQHFLETIEDKSQVTEKKIEKLNLDKKVSSDKGDQNADILTTKQALRKDSKCLSIKEADLVELAAEATKIDCSINEASVPTTSLFIASSSDPKSISIDYTVKSGHLPGQYGMSLQSNKQQSTTESINHAEAGEKAVVHKPTAAKSKLKSKEERDSVKDESKLEGASCSGVGGQAKSASPKKGPNVVAPWEDEQQRIAEICPWEDEDNCKIDTPFVKAYATLGYL